MIEQKTTFIAIKDGISTKGVRPSMVKDFEDLLKSLDKIPKPRKSSK